MAKSVINRLLPKDHVEDVAARADVLAESLGDGMARFAPRLAIRLADEGESLLERQRPAIDVDPNCRAQLVKQPVPRRVPDRAELREHSLLGLGQLMRPVLPRLLDGVAVASRLGMCKQLRRLLIRD